MPHIAPLKREDLPEFEPMFTGTERVLGAVPNSFLTLGHKPRILAAFALLSGTIFNRYRGPISLKKVRFLRAFLKESKKATEIPPQLQQMVAYISSYAAGCRYCQAHTAESLHLMEVPDDKIQALPKYDTSGLFSDAERAALDFAFAASQVPNESTPQHFRALKEHFTDAQIVELVSVIALFGFLNRWNDTMATALEEVPRAFAENALSPGGWAVGKHAD